MSAGLANAQRLTSLCGSGQLRTSVSTRPFRLRPPSTERALLRRTVQRELAARFERRVTLVVAGAGFGKSTSLAQAIEQNRLVPRGVDVWLACEPADVEAEHLLAGLRSAVGLDPDGHLDAMIEQVAAHAPVDVCLVLDDVHELTTGSSGAELLDRVLADLPANGHVVLASRRAPSVALARLDAQGQVWRLDEATLALSQDEVARLAAREGVAVDQVDDLGGWPALVSLALRSRDARDFVNEEVVSWLSGDQQQALSLIVATGGADERLVSELLDIDAEAALAGLPLVHEAEGWFEAHDLWRDRLLATLSTDEADELRARTVELLLEWGEPERATDVCLLGGLTEQLPVALRSAILNVSGLSPAVMRRWLGLLPDSVRRLPIARFLAGLVVRAEAPTAPRCLGLFEEAAEGFSKTGDGRGEVEALAQMGYVHHVQRDAAALSAVGERLAELAFGGVATALPYLQVATAFVGLSAGQPAVMREALGKIEHGTLTPEFATIADWLEAQAQNMSGFSAIAAAERCVASNLPIPGIADVQLGARWHAGDIDFLTDETRWAQVPDGDRDRFLRHLFRAGTASATGRHDTAEREVEAARLIAETDPGPVTTIVMNLARFVLDLSADPSMDAGEAIGKMLEAEPVNEVSRFWYDSMRGRFARHRPDLWHHWADVESGPYVRRDRDIGFALGAIDREGVLTATEQLAWPDHHGELLTSAGLGGACLLVTAAWSLGRPQAAEAASWLSSTVGAPARAQFHSLAVHELEAIAKAATEITAQTPVPPSDPVGIRLLGAPELRRGSAVTEHRDWRRDNVRALFTYLVINQSVTRDQAMAALWPEASEDSARRSIRSTLNLLQGVLEPERAAGDAPFFVRSDGAILRLVGDTDLQVDVWDFDRRLGEADSLIADGVPELAMAPLRLALATYGGDLAPDLFHDWLGPERARLRSRFVNAGAALLALLLSTGELEETLAVAAAVLVVEPWAEDAHRATILAHMERGDRPGAVRAAERCNRELAEIGGASQPETQSLIDRLT